MFRVIPRRLNPDMVQFMAIRHSSSSTASPKNIGFIGLGNMGANMAENLMKKGHNLVIYDVTHGAGDHLVSLGATMAKNGADLASRVDHIVTMLPASLHVRKAYTGPDGIIKGLKPGTLLIDSSTIDGEVSIEMSHLALDKKAIYLDAPVSGGVPAAKAGTLTFMVGGPEREFKLIEPILMKMGQKVVHCGKVGLGQAAKICNNMLLAISMIGVSDCTGFSIIYGEEFVVFYSFFATDNWKTLYNETMNLGIRMGLDPKLLSGILNSSSGRCWSSDTYNPVPGLMQNVPSSNNYQGGFGTFLMTKDLSLASNAATSTQTSTPLGALSFQIYRMMCNHGYALKDFSSVFKYLQDQQEQK